MVSALFISEAINYLSNKYGSDDLNALVFGPSEYDDNYVDLHFSNDPTKTFSIEDISHLEGLGWMHIPYIKGEEGFMNGFSHFTMWML